MQAVETIARIRRQLTRSDFERKYPHPWLIRELDDSEQSAMFRTMVSVKRPTMPPKRAPAGTPFARSLTAEPDRFGLYPLVKSGSNPWTDRILVGRASNNDIVLRNDRISKLHAYFQLGARGIWRIYDARSANGTRVEGEVVLAGEDGRPVRSGHVITFGNVACELIGSGELYDALVARTEGHHGQAR